MTTLELQAKKAELAKRILNSDNEELITKLADLYDKLAVNKYPCDYTEDEVLQACEAAMQEYETGTLSHDQIKRKTS
ncbi:hypothetical protein [Parabacteroides sp. PF5-9]|uniref:hypothetical protein n=1 Tax=Parabacteroides sp. PF5-9 TaxID=1742404 RepID=UPI002476208D|nr:hypothetical protein [Parabacteroides sp. PF5-9]MDH6356382.1 hypothetical protein [Parabacteroides sp. PF5-9]